MADDKPTTAQTPPQPRPVTPDPGAVLRHGLGPLPDENTLDRLRGT